MQNIQILTTPVCKFTFNLAALVSNKACAYDIPPSSVTKPGKPGVRSNALMDTTANATGDDVKHQDSVSTQKCTLGRWHKKRGSGVCPTPCMDHVRTQDDPQQVAHLSSTRCFGRCPNSWSGHAWIARTMLPITDGPAGLPCCACKSVWCEFKM